MKKYNLIFALISLNLGLAFGQNITMTNGAVFGKESLLHKWVVVDKNDKDISIIENLAPYLNSAYYLKKLDRNTLQTISEKPIASMGYPDYIGRLGGNIIAIDRTLGSQKEKFKVDYCKYSLEGELVGNKSIVPGFEDRLDPADGFNDRTFQYLKKEDKKLAFVYYTKNSATTELLEYCIFDEKINVIKSGKISIPSKFKSTIMHQIITDWQDNFYITLSEGDLKPLEYKTMYLVHANIASSKVTFKPIEFGNAKIWNTNFKTMDDNRVIGFGLYSDEDKSKGLSAKGAISMSYSPNVGELKVNDKVKLPVDIVSKLENEKAAKNDKGIGDSYITREYVEDKTNNGFIIGLEKFFGYSEIGRFTFNFNFIQELLLCFLDKDLKITGFYAHKRKPFKPTPDYINQPMYKVFFNGNVKCIVAADDRFETNSISLPKDLFGTSVLKFSKDNALLSDVNFPYEQDNKKRIFYHHPTTAVSLSDNEVLYYADLYNKAEASNPLRPKEIQIKYVKMSFK